MLLVVLGYLVVLPLIQLQRVALEDGAAGYQNAFSDPDFSEALTTTIGLALGSLVIAMFLGTSLAYAAMRVPRPLRFLRVIPVFGIVLPTIATIVGWMFLLSPRVGYLNSLLRNLPWWANLSEGPVDIYRVEWIVVVTGLILSSIVYLFVSAGLRNINSELLEAAVVNGSSELSAFFRITVPLLAPALGYAASVVLLIGLGQFGGPLILGRQNGVDVLATEMFRSATQSPVDYGTAAAFGSPLLLAGIIVVLVQRLVLGDRGRFVTHGRTPFRSSTRSSRLAAGYLVIYGVVAIGLPLAAIVNVALSPFWTSRVDVREFTLQNIRSAFGDARLKDAVLTSVTLSLVAVVAAVVLGYIASQVLLFGRGNRVLRSMIDLVVLIPLGIPSVIFGAAFLLTYTRPPFVLYGTPWVIILVYVTLMIPFSTRMLSSGMVALGEQYIEASRVSGAGVIRTNAQILVPLLRPAMAGAGALMFVLLSHELSASLLVRSSTTEVMGTILYDYFLNGSYPLVATMALIMFAITAIGVVAAVLLGGRSALDRL